MKNENDILDHWKTDTSNNFQNILWFTLILSMLIAGAYAVYYILQETVGRVDLYPYIILIFISTSFILLLLNWAFEK